MLEIKQNSHTQDYNKKFIEEVIRVNHAGEYGAVIIYSAQEKVFKDQATKNEISEMKQQEKKHLEYFTEQIIQNKIRPTLLLPLWSILGNALGKITAYMGKEAAMACTVAVEEVISDHYQQQLDKLSEGDLRKKIAQFREEELEHHDIALSNNAENAFAYNTMSNLIKGVCKLAIKLSKVI